MGRGLSRFGSLDSEAVFSSSSARLLAPTKESHEIPRKLPLGVSHLVLPD